MTTQILPFEIYTASVNPMILPGLLEMLVKTVRFYSSQIHHFSGPVNGMDDLQSQVALANARQTGMQKILPLMLHIVNTIDRNKGGVEYFFGKLPPISIQAKDAAWAIIRNLEASATSKEEFFTCLTCLTDFAPGCARNEDGEVTDPSACLMLYIFQIYNTYLNHDSSADEDEDSEYDGEDAQAMEARVALTKERLAAVGLDFDSLEETEKENCIESSLYIAIIGQEKLTTEAMGPLIGQTVINRLDLQILRFVAELCDCSTPFGNGEGVGNELYLEYLMYIVNLTGPLWAIQGIPIHQVTQCPGCKMFFGCVCQNSELARVNVQLSERPVEELCDDLSAVMKSLNIDGQQAE